MALPESMPKSLRKLYSLLLGRPSNFSWLRKGRIAGSGLPFGKRSFLWLKNHGVSAILCLTEEPEGKETAEIAGLEYIHLPMINRQPEQADNLDRAVDSICQQLDKGNAILVHCQAGQGRTGMVLAAYLIREEGKTAKQSIDEVRSLRPGSLKRKAQVKAVEEYEVYVRAGIRAKEA